MANIKEIFARRIIDSRGNPTVECDITLDNGMVARAAVPSGASTGAHEALELRDFGAAYMGKDVTKAIANVNEIIAPAIVGMNPEAQREIDNKMLALDGTPNKAKLGANAILAVSMAAAKAAAMAKKVPLFKHLGDLFGNSTFNQPKPMMNIINGGSHAANPIDVQEFMIIPQAETIGERIRIGAEIFHKLQKVLKGMGQPTNVGDEGGFAPNLESTRAALDTIMKAGEGYDFKLALDVAATEFYKDGVYHFEGKELSSAEMVEFYAQLITEYPFVSIEDGMSEDDWDGWKMLTDRIGDKVQLVGDDLFVTNPERLKRGIDNGIANAILVKLNQIGSLSETFDAIKMAKDAGYNTIISHRSGETEDTFIADLSVGVNAGQIKTGSMSRTDRTAKYNQLLRIDEVL